MLTYEEIRAFSESACQSEAAEVAPRTFVATREQVEKSIRAALAHATQKSTPTHFDMQAAERAVDRSFKQCDPRMPIRFGVADAVKAGLRAGVAAALTEGNRAPIDVHQQLQE